MLSYWGKAGDAGAYLPLPYHQLDIAAVGHQLLACSPALAKRLVRLAGLPEPVHQNWTVFFLAIHDLGKFSRSFQNLRKDLTQQGWGFQA